MQAWKFFLAFFLIPMTATADPVFPTKLSDGNDLPICAGERGEIIRVSLSDPFNPKFRESWDAIRRGGTTVSLWRRSPTMPLMQLPIKALVRACHGWSNIENVITVDGRQSVLADESCADIYGANFTLSYQCPNSLLGTAFECQDRPIRRQPKSTQKQGQCNTRRDLLESLGTTATLPFVQLESPRVPAAWSVPSYGSGHTIPILVGAPDDLPYRVCGSLGFEVKVTKKDGSTERKSLASCVIVAGTDISIVQLGKDTNRFGTYERYPL